MTKSFITITVCCLSIWLTGCEPSSKSIATTLNTAASNPAQQMFVIEREIPNAGKLTQDELKAISMASCNIIEEIGTDQLSWLHSYVTEHKVYCIYTATDEDKIKDHARQGGFPANKIEKVSGVIHPGTAD